MHTVQTYTDYEIVSYEDNAGKVFSAKDLLTNPNRPTKYIRLLRIFIGMKAKLVIVDKKGTKNVINTELIRVSNENYTLGNNYILDFLDNALAIIHPDGKFIMKFKRLERI